MLLSALLSRRIARSLAPVAAATLLVVSAACGGGDSVTDPLPVANLAFASEADTVALGGTKQLTATLRDGQGAVVTSATLHWSSVDASIATVSSTGVATGVSAGTTTIRVSSSGRTASLRLVVQAQAPSGGQPAPVPAPALPSGSGDGSYSIRVVWPESQDARVSALVDNAIARWRRVITGDLPNVTFDIKAGDCYDGQPASRETVDDLLVFVRVVKIDGSGGTLARAGPCLVRNNRGLPLVGLVELDSADVGRDPAVVQTVLTHELGHVLGIGTMWEYRSLLHGMEGDNPLFLGATAQSAYSQLGGGSQLVPVENTGGEGTKGGHWRESSFRTELMTGWISVGTNPLSTITVASLRDLGYAVNMGAADSYALPTSSVANARIVGGGVELVDEVIRPTIAVDENGGRRRIPN